MQTYLFLLTPEVMGCLRLVSNFFHQRSYLHCTSLQGFVGPHIILGLGLLILIRNAPASPGLLLAISFWQNMFSMEYWTFSWKLGVKKHTFKIILNYLTEPVHLNINLGSKVSLDPPYPLKPQTVWHTYTGGGADSALPPSRKISATMALLNAPVRSQPLWHL